jgi:hypothetical protein
VAERRGLLRQAAAFWLLLAPGSIAVNWWISFHPVRRPEANFFLPSLSSVC